jgi:hypothetical protein
MANLGHSRGFLFDAIIHRRYYEFSEYFSTISLKLFSSNYCFNTYYLSFQVTPYCRENSRKQYQYTYCEKSANEIMYVYV